LDIKQNHLSILRKTVFPTNLEQIFKRTATDLETTDKDAAEIDICAQKFQVAAASTIWAITFSSESTSHRNTQPSLNWKERLGLAFQFTVPHANELLPTGPH